MSVKKFKTTLLLPDAHFPMEDKAAFSVALQIAKDCKPTEVCILGDWWELATLSSYDKSAELQMTSVREEIQTGIEAMHLLHKMTKPQTFCVHAGNHLHRFHKWVNKNAAALHAYIDIKDVFQIDRRWVFVEYGGPKSYWRIPWTSAITTHGSICGANPGKGMLDKYKTSTFYGHTHSASIYAQTDLYGKSIYAVNCGHISDVDKVGTYLSHPPSWQQAICLVHSLKSGKFFFELISIQDGEAVFNGSIVSA